MCEKRQGGIGRWAYLQQPIASTMEGGDDGGVDVAAIQTLERGKERTAEERRLQWLTRTEKGRKQGKNCKRRGGGGGGDDSEGENRRGEVRLYPLRLY